MRMRYHPSLLFKSLYIISRFPKAHSFYSENRKFYMPNQIHEHIVMEMGYTYIKQPPHSNDYVRHTTTHIYIKENALSVQFTPHTVINDPRTHSDSSLVKLGLALILHRVCAYCIIFIWIRSKGFIMMIILCASSTLPFRCMHILHTIIVEHSYLRIYLLVVLWVCDACICASKRKTTFWIISYIIKYMW